MKPKIIYIAGYGRSGSTVVDIMLGMHPEIFGAGELSTMCRHVWRENEYCACGARLNECDVWEPVMKRWTKECDPDDYFALQRSIEPLYAPGRMIGGAKLEAYLNMSRAMFSAIRDQTGQPIILDSSKAPGRALALASDPKIDLRVIHLVRDARAVAHALGRAIPVDVAQGVQKKIVPRSPLRTALRWRMYNSVAERLRTRLAPNRSVRVRYEDISRNPLAELKRISSAVDVDLTEVGSQISQGAKIVPAHQMAGSRLRMKGPMALRYNSDWETEMPKAAKRQVELITGAQLWRYGYSE
ncbi:sulfotransferase [uncultured Aliiroseovarius sp.]|uniref:sulfotransferase n=1 Tax=uncultured Aliiroseovarius sp. TaxID=1658783 RepID=UPI00260D53E1|nr:sulfotransferase [uncultured Aliiroseovarius sp.]